MGMKEVGMYYNFARRRGNRRKSGRGEQVIVRCTISSALSSRPLGIYYGSGTVVFICGAVGPVHRGDGGVARKWRPKMPKIRATRRRGAVSMKEINRGISSESASKSVVGGRTICGHWPPAAGRENNGSYRIVA